MKHCFSSLKLARTSQHVSGADRDPAGRAPRTQPTEAAPWRPLAAGPDALQRATCRTCPAGNDSALSATDRGLCWLSSSGIQNENLETTYVSKDHQTEQTWGQTSSLHTVTTF